MFNVRAVIKAAVFTPYKNGWGLPVVLEGDPGIGKTSYLEDSAVWAGMPCLTYTSSMHDPVDAHGVIKPVDTHFRYLTPPWIQKALKWERGIVVFDEMTAGSTANQAPFLRALTHKEIAEETLPPGTRVIGAANPASSSFGGSSMEPTVANRVGHIQVSVNMEEFISYLLFSSGKTNTEERFDAAAHEAEVLKEWPDAFKAASQDVAAFLRTSPHLAHNMPADPDKAAGAWPSPRTWEMATYALASARVHDLNDVDTASFVGAFIGAAGTEFCAWLATPLPKVEEILSGEWMASGSRPDIASRAFSMVRRHCEQKSSAKFWTVLKNTYVAVPTLKGLCIGFAFDVRRDRDSKIPRDGAEFKEATEHFKSVLGLANNA